MTGSRAGANGSERRSTLLVAGGLLIVLAVGVGFALGRATGGDERPAAGGSPEGAVAVDGVDASPATEAPAAVGDTVAPADSLAPSPEEASDALAAVAGDPVPTGSFGQGGPGGQWEHLEYREAELVLVAQRTAPSGITVRVHLSPPELSAGLGTGLPDEGGGDGGDGGDGDGWRRAGWCFPSASMRITVVTEAAAAVVYGSWFDEPLDGLAVSSFSFGEVERSPGWGLVVHAPAAATAGVRLADGRGDTAEVVGGVAVLAVDGSVPPEFTLELTPADGSTPIPVASSELAASFDSDRFHAECEPPPPALPAAGEQPGDAESAEAAVRALFDEVYGGLGEAMERNDPNIDDVSGIADSLERLASGPYAGNAGSADAVVRELVFTTPGEAWVRYDLVTDISTFRDRFGIARRSDDGRWRLTRQTICQDLALAPGAECIPTVDVLRPPGS